MVLQEEKYWKEFLERNIIPENNASELYFEETDIEGFIDRLEKYYPDVKYVNRLMTHSWGQKVIRFGGRTFTSSEVKHTLSQGSIITFTGKKKRLQCAVDGYSTLIVDMFPDIITNEIQKGAETNDLCYHRLNEYTGAERKG